MFSAGDDSGASPYFQQLFDHGDLGGADGIGAFAGGGDAQCQALLYNLSVLREKVRLLHPLVGLASSMMYAFQHLCAVSDAAMQAQDSVAAAAGRAASNNAAGMAAAAAGCSDQQLQALEEDHEAATMQQWAHGGFYDDDGTSGSKPSAATAQQEAPAPAPGTKTRIIELDAAELLAKYTHYCKVCGKGFKRDANLRMHMRAHGDQYKSKAALSAVVSSSGASSSPAAMAASKYSCPQEGCRWNVRHARFTPLKSVICAKNHYRRSHCPKMYACSRCGRKQFSVLSDLRTHEKHCGDRRWLCSCGTTFSRKDKLAGHVSLFAGHHPVVVGEGARQCKIDRSSLANSDQLLGNCTTSAGDGFSIT